MRLEIEAAGRIRVVDVGRPLGRSEVIVDGRAQIVDAARIGDIWSLIVGAADAGIDGVSRGARSYEVALVERPSGELVVHVNGMPITATVLGAARRTGRVTPRTARSADAKRGPLRLVAPMPGRIVKLLVEVGEAVAANQGLVVVEAMKMENELRSPRAGTVAEIHAREGALVEANAVLLVIE